jgi:PAS domain S-box-containing protein
MPPAALTLALAKTPVETFDVAVIATTLEGVIRYWNRAAEALYGWERDEVLGRNIVDVTVAEESAAKGAEIMAALAAGKAWRGVFKVRKRSGQVFDAFVIDTPVPALRSDMVAVVGASGPIEDRRRITQRNALLWAELRRHLGDVWVFPDADRLEQLPAEFGTTASQGRYYRCYLADAGGVFCGVREGVFASDEDALAFARASLEGRPDYASAEVWQMSRAVGGVRRG